MGTTTSKVQQDYEEVFDSILKEYKDGVLELKEYGDMGYENLVFEGGGVKGVAYAGAIKVRHTSVVC